ncbi:MAG: hypothetical protein KC431_08130, partial [Myxococcales bacterium]|nr:hypothetical protein [Myxococcales bacterium]
MQKDEGCPCAGSGVCNQGLICIDDICVDENSCAPADPDVLVFYNLIWAGDPVDFAQASCLAEAAVMGDSVDLIITECSDALDLLEIQLSPALALGDIQQLPVDVSIVFLSGQLYVAASVGSYSVLLIDAGSLESMLFDAPWQISAVGSECPPSMVDCGSEQRIGVSIEEITLYDGNAGEFSGGSAWVDTAVDGCAPHFLMAVVGG